MTFIHIRGKMVPWYPLDCIKGVLTRVSRVFFFQRDKDKMAFSSGKTGHTAGLEIQKVEAFPFLLTPYNTEYNTACTQGLQHLGL